MREVLAVSVMGLIASLMSRSGMTGFSKEQPTALKRLKWNL